MAEMEKLNIRIPSSVKQRLDDDAALFEITKENGEINRNEFLNRIIDGYYPQYDEYHARLEKNIHDIIGDDLKASEVLDCVLKEIQGYQMNRNIKNNCSGIIMRLHSASKAYMTPPSECGFNAHNNKKRLFIKSRDPLII